MTPSRAAISHPLDTLPTPGAVAAAAGTTVEELQEIVNARDRLLHPFHVSKKGKRGTRRVYRVAEPAAALHRKIALWVRDSWTNPHDAVHGFRKRRSIVSNATVHLAQDVVVTADIENFFGSITETHVDAAFRFLGASEEVAALLASLTTFEGALPPGTRCSPIIANVVCRDLDVELTGLGDRYSRYADDLAFSGPRASVPSPAAIEAALARHGFRLRAASYREMEKKRLQFVTGLLVNHKHGPHVPGRQKRELEVAVHYIVKFGLSSHCKHINEQDEGAYLAKLMGQLHQVASVERDFAITLLKTLQAKLAKEDEEAPPEDDGSFWP